MREKKIISNDQLDGFEKLLNETNVETVSEQSYCNRYLQHLLEHKKYYLAIYADVLEKLLLHTDKEITAISLVDIGAGNGLLSLFAKYCGFKKVYVNDIDPAFTNASQNLAQQLKIPIDGFITGDIETVAKSLSNEKPDAIIGTDVIEHIYNLETFFSTIKRINPFVVTIFTTASNPVNFIKVRQLKKLQIKDEYSGGSPDDFALFGNEPHASFLQIRKDIIKNEWEEATDDQLDAFAKATRGMNKDDIVAAVKEYKISQKMPKTPMHSTNTCNPLTGSWTERILTINEYASIYHRNEMKMMVFNGFYNVYKPGLKGLLNKILNQAVIRFGSRFAPYLIFAGSKK